MVVLQAKSNQFRAIFARDQPKSQKICKHAKLLGSTSMEFSMMVRLQVEHFLCKNQRSLNLVRNCRIWRARYFRFLLLSHRKIQSEYIFFFSISPVRNFTNILTASRTLPLHWYNVHSHYHAACCCFLDFFLSGKGKAQKLFALSKQRLAKKCFYHLRIS
jgi:hypothetical protein